MACGRGFKSRQLHHYLKSQPFGVGFFLPIAACLRGFLRVPAGSCGFLRVLADFKVSPVWQSQPIFSLRAGYPVQVEVRKMRFKPYINQ